MCNIEPMPSPSTDQKPSIVYVAINLVNGKWYIGVTCRTLRMRICGHMADVRGGNRRRFPNAIRKYGIENFSFHVVRHCASYSEALAQERKLIAFWQPEYNLTEGGEGALGFKHTQESIRRMKAWHAANPTRRRLGVKAPGSGIKAYLTKVAKGTVARPWLGKKRDDATNARISATKCSRSHLISDESKAKHAANLSLGRIVTRKPVVCLNDGVEYISVIEAAKKYGLQSAKVSAVLTGARTHTRGFVFRFLEAA